MCVVLFILAIFLGGFRAQEASGTFQREVQNPLNCNQDERATDGDRLTVSYTAWLNTGEMIDETPGDFIIQFVLGEKEVIKGWEEGFNQTCAGEDIVMILPPEYNQGFQCVGRCVISPQSTLFFKATLESISRTTAAAPHKKINEKNEEERIFLNGKCRDVKTVKEGDKVTLKTIVTLVFGSSIRGTVIDDSESTVKVGEGRIVPGLDKGILGACEGEKRRLILGPKLAFGNRGVPRLVPPQATLIFDVTVKKVERDQILRFLSQLASDNFRSGR